MVKYSRRANAVKKQSRKANIFGDFVKNYEKPGWRLGRARRPTLSLPAKQHIERPGFRRCFRMYRLLNRLLIFTYLS